jgi:hypothetical protein
MKKSVKILSSLLIVFLAFASVCYGQDEVKIRRTQKLHFENESTKAEIKVEVTDVYNYVVFDIQCQLYQGEVLVEVFDPNGDKQGFFTVKSDDGTVSGENTKAESSVRGQMAKVFGKPLPGEWKIKANPTSAMGDLAAFITLGFEPRIDMIDLRSLK